MLSERKSFSLSEVAQSIQRMFDAHWNKPVLIRAEMNKLNHYPASGHCYPVLVEKKHNKVAAEMRATLWKVHYERINTAFLEKVKEPLKDGMQVLMEAYVRYHPVHGLSLEIVDIDPSFSLGDLERERAESIRLLNERGLFNENRGKSLSLLPLRWAIISVETSKGYSDFMEILRENAFGFQFFHYLFPAVLQGDKSPPEVIRQLRRIASVAHRFDAVAIVRGGGGDVGLSCYNNYALCEAICRFPLPVFTGIGHSTNLTVAEMVSHTNGITPTDLANRILSLVLQGVAPLNDLELRLLQSTHGMMKLRTHELLHLARSVKKSTTHRMALEHVKLDQTVRQVRLAPVAMVRRQRDELQALRRQAVRAMRAPFVEEQREREHLRLRLVRRLRVLLTRESERVSSLDNAVKHLDPTNVLRRGYSITRLEGRSVLSTENLTKGMSLETTLASGTFVSVIASTTSPTDHE
jgi:exodeoxyribonuclease VII large subunit